MISVSEARDIITQNIFSLAPINFKLENASGKVLAEDIYALLDIPAYPQSSMDGYAISFHDWQKNKKLKIQGESAAGSQQNIKLLPGNAVRIFTGAPVPAGADTVVIQEKTKIENGFLIIEDDRLAEGTSVRAKGSEIKKGMMALEKGSLLTPPAIGFLAGIGATIVSAYPIPSVSIIITGNELQEPGKQLTYGQVYESNSFALKAILHQSGIEEIKLFRAEDTLDAVVKVLKEALQYSDLILFTGGISVGDYDFVLQAAETCGVQQLFHKVKQRPGKPLYFGKKETKVVFGLPGNPSSVLTCFYEYVLLAVSKMTKKELQLKKLIVPIEKSIQKNTSLTHFAKGFYNGNTAVQLEAQYSYQMSSFATANCLIKIEEDVTLIKENEMVEIHLLPC